MAALEAAKDFEAEYIGSLTYSLLCESLMSLRGKIILSGKCIQRAEYTFIILGIGIKLLCYILWETFLNGIVLNGFHCIFGDDLHILEIINLWIDMLFESL